MEYTELVDVYEALDATTKRLEMTHILADALESAADEDLERVVLLLQGKVFPAWQKDKKLGMSSNYIIKVIQRVCGVSETRVNNVWAEKGDLGLVAQALSDGKSQQTLVSENLTVKKVFDNIRQLPEVKGSGSVDRKVQLVAELVSSASPSEAKYIVRTVLEVLRLGVGSGTLRDAIAWAFLDIDFDYEDGEIAVDDRDAYEAKIELVQGAYDKLNDFAEVARVAKEGEDALREVEIEVGRPLQVMLAKTVENVDAGFDEVGTPAQLEYKYDGFRMEIHKYDDTITVFTRRLEDVTEQFPEVVQYVRERVEGDSFILDAEAVGYDPDTKEYTAFQQISQRIRRKYSIEKLANELPVEVNVFDVLYCDGESYLEKPLRERREQIESMIDGAPYRLRPAHAIMTGAKQEAQDFYAQAKDEGMEGIMMKNLDGRYKPGNRVGYMVKLKPTMETLDLVIVSAEWGEGKRSGWLTSYTLACIDEGEYKTIGKVATGIKELEDAGGVTFEEMTEMLQPLVVHESGRDVEVKPEVVIEVKFNEIQQSPTYESGYALRFPRLVTVRDDRDPEDISSLSFIRSLYDQQ